MKVEKGFGGVMTVKTLFFCQKVFYNQVSLNHQGSTVDAIDLFSQFSTVKANEDEGTLTQLPDCGDTLWRVARSGNKKYNRLLSQLYKRNRAVLDSKGDEAEKKSDEILAEVFAKTILLGWEGEILYRGKKYPYSYEQAKILLGHKDFRTKVASIAEDFTNFKEIQEGEDIPNSQPSLTGKSSGAGN